MLHRIDLRLGVLVLLGFLATLVEPLPGVRVHHHAGGHRAHVHLEDVGQHGHHGRSGVHPHHSHRAPTRGCGAGLQARRGRTPGNDDNPTTVGVASKADGHLHTFTVFLPVMRSATAPLAVALLTAAVRAPSVSKPPQQSPLGALARGPPTHPLL